jgi:hypothetical protein
VWMWTMDPTLVRRPAGVKNQGMRSVLGDRRNSFGVL